MTLIELFLLIIVGTWFIFSLYKVISILVKIYKEIKEDEKRDEIIRKMKNENKTN